MSALKKNIASLYFVQAANYLVPLVTLPYLSRVLGLDHFGIYGIALGVVSIMTLVTDWGFSLSATQEIARHSQEPEILHRLFWDTFWARVSLGALSFLGLGLVMLAVPSVRGLGMVLLAASAQVLPSMLGVGWFLQGLERMGSYAIASIAGRALAIPLTILLVHKPSDVVLATAIPGLCGLVASAVSFHVARRFTTLVPVRFDPAGSFRQLRAGAKIFLSMGAINLYTASSVLILSALAGTAQVGLYHGADRIRRAVQTLIGPVGLAIFPRVNSLLGKDITAARRLMLRMLIGQGAFTLLLSLIMFFAAPWGVPLALGSAFVGAVPVVRWLAPTPFLAGLSNVMGINIMLPLGMKNEVTIIVLVSAALNLGAMLALCPLYGATGAAIAALITETFVTGLMALVLLRRFGRRWVRALELVGGRAA